MRNIFLPFLFVFFGYQVNAQNIYNVEKLDSLFNIISANDLAMGSISIFSNGEEVYQHSMGYLDLEKKIKANPSTKYRIGSITKTFTAVVILQLMEEGKLEMNTLLKEFLPQVPNSEKITVQHLLRHQSGLFNITDDKDFRSWMTIPQIRKEMLDRLIKNGILFEPAEKTEYSNTNYLLLSYIAEVIEDNGYAEIVKNRIIDKLNLANTFYGGKINPEDNQARSYVKSEKKWDLAPETDMSVPMGAGALVSTPGDLNTFFCNLFEGNLVSENSLKAMKSITNGMGIGLMKLPVKEIEGYGHGGGIDGFSSVAVHLPNENLNIAFIANALDYPLNNILMGVMKIILEQEYELPDFSQAKK
jgi:D-alanyl-D-alanine carboxypeptidase